MHEGGKGLLYSVCKGTRRMVTAREGGRGERGCLSMFNKRQNARWKGAYRCLGGEKMHDWGKWVLVSVLEGEGP